VARLERAPGPVVAEGRHAGMDQSRKLTLQRRSAKTQRIELTLRRRLEQNVGGLEQRLKTLAVCLLLKIELDRALAAVVLPEEQRSLGVRLVLVERPDAARRAAARRLHLHDVCTEPREREAAIFGLLVGELDDPNARQRARSHGVRHGIRTSVRG